MGIIRPKKQCEFCINVKNLMISQSCQSGSVGYVHCGALFPINRSVKCFDPLKVVKMTIKRHAPNHPGIG